MAFNVSWIINDKSGVATRSEDLRYAIYTCGELDGENRLESVMSAKLSGVADEPLGYDEEDGSVIEPNAWYGLFDSCVNMTSCDLSELNTDDCTSMAYCFYGCESLVDLDVSGIRTGAMPYTQGMFSGCSSLTSLDLSNFDFSNSLSIYALVRYCESLEELIFPENMNTSKVEDFSYIFDGCKKLKEINAGGWDTARGADFTYPFGGCESVEKIDISGWNFNRIDDIRNMFMGLASLKEVVWDGIVTDNILYLNDMFNGCTSLETVDLSQLTGHNYKWIQEMFYNCSSLKHVVLDFDTYNAQQMGAMFSGCSSLLSVYIKKKFTFRDCRTIVDFFKNCSNLRKIYVEKDYELPSYVSKTSAIFTGCNNLCGLQKCNGFGNTPYWSTDYFLTSAKQKIFLGNRAVSVK